MSPEKMPNEYEGESVPTIQSALEKPENMESLREEIAKFSAEDRQKFLEGLQAVERYMSLENERLDMKTVAKELATVGVSGVIAFLVMLAIAPDIIATVPGTASAAATGIITGSAAMTPAFLLGARNRKRETIARLRTLRNAVIDAGK